jgi:hypothetical protein
MALEKTTVEDKIEIVGEFKTIQVRTATIISEDGVELSRTFSRHSINPTDDISNESAEVQGVCNAVHTQAVKDAYTAHMNPVEPVEGE